MELDAGKITRLSFELERALLGERQNQTIRMLTPWLSLPEGFSFMPIFPFTGAAVRFLVRKDSAPLKEVSVYLDVKNILGCFDGPYWDAYPMKGSSERFKLSEGKELIEEIVKELNGENENKVPEEFDDLMAH